MSTLTRMYVAAGKVLANRSADACGIDRGDNWKTYGDEFIADAIAVMDAIGADDMLTALRGLLAWHDATHNNSRDAIEAARAAVRKATGEAA